MDLSSFIQENCGFIFEGIRSRDIEKAKELIKKYLEKRKIYTIPITATVRVDGKTKQIVQVYNDKYEGAAFVWDIANTSQIEAVAFTKDYLNAYSTLFYPDTCHNYEVYVLAKGANTVKMMRVVEDVLKGKVKMNVADIRERLRGAQLFESLVVEASDDPVLAGLKRQKQSMYHKLRDWKNKGKNVDDLQKQYDELCAKIDDARLSVRPNVTVTSATDKDLEAVQYQFEEEERATPEERFGDMKSYIYNVIKGIRPLALLCGAPGVGKTFRVMQAVKGTGLEQDEGYRLLKGKCTPSALFTALHDFKKPGQLLIMDDCDSVFKDDDAINLLKAAFDSSDERWVTWNVSTNIPMSTELAETCDDAVWDDVKDRWYYPKQFLYEGGGIIITNFRAGQIDTAVRNRALICDLDFTTEEILSLIRGLAPKIMPDVLTPEAKEQALDYLEELANKNAPVELSIRSFTLVAGIFGSNDSDKSKKRQIREQMRLQSERGGKKY